MSGTRAQRCRSELPDVQKVRGRERCPCRAQRTAPTEVRLLKRLRERAAAIADRSGRRAGIGLSRRRKRDVGFKPFQRAGTVTTTRWHYSCGVSHARRLRSIVGLNDETVA